MSQLSLIQSPSSANGADRITPATSTPSRQKPRFLRRDAVARAWREALAPRVIAMVEHSDSIFLATADADGAPYVQHRGGPPGFLHVLDAHTIAFADFGGNRQYTTVDNLAENPRAFLFLIDFARGQRIKFAGTARVSTDAELMARLTPPGYPAEVERAIVFDVAAWSANCSQHIPHLVPAGAATGG